MADFQPSTDAQIAFFTMLGAAVVFFDLPDEEYSSEMFLAMMRDRHRAHLDHSEHLSTEDEADLARLVHILHNAVQIATSELLPSRGY